MRQQILIGRQDVADFPELKLEKVEVKIDTGAYTSSFHCHTIHVVSNDGKDELHCFFLDPEHERYNNRECIFNQFSLKKVRSSNGLLEERYSVETTIRLFEKIIPLELTLTERGNMRFPVLLGRKFLSGRFVVDSSRKNLSDRGIVSTFTVRKRRKEHDAK
ncbi:MAG: RimK/LysX family protein [Prolixibacteraceae bacterium]